MSTRSLLNTSFDSVSPRLIAFIFYFYLRSVVSSSSNSPCCEYDLRYLIKSNQFISVTVLLPQYKTTQRTDLSFRSHCDLSIERVCLGTNMADSNRRHGKSHVGENQECFLRSVAVVIAKTRYYADYVIMGRWHTLWFSQYVKISLICKTYINTYIEPLSRRSIVVR